MAKPRVRRTFEIEVEIYEMLKVLAQEERRSINNTMERLIVAAFEASHAFEGKEHG